MNFGLETFRELIEDFLTNSGGRRGRRREQRREELGDEAGTDVAGAAADAETNAADGDATNASTTDETDTPPESEADESDGSGGLFGGNSSSGDEDLDDLYYRIEELEDELEDKSSTLGSVQDSQQQVADQVEEMNDRVRQLLGVYDQVTDDVNPFTGEGEAQDGFGVFGEADANDGNDGSTEGGFEFDEPTEPPRSGTDETVSFGDLKGMIDEAARAEAADGGRTITFDEDDVIEGAERDDTHVEVQATENVDRPDDEAAGDEAAAETESDDPNDVTLTALADTYATDIIVFEWLTQLVRTAGSAATLRAISYYAEIGGIDEEV